MKLTSRYYEDCLEARRIKIITKCSELRERAASKDYDGVNRHVAALFALNAEIHFLKEEQKNLNT